MSVNIEIIGTDTGFIELKTTWNALVKQSKHPTIFLTWEWLYTWWKYFGEGKKLYILVARDPKKQLQGIAPLCVTNERWGWQRLSIAKFLGTQPISSEYLDFIIPFPDSLLVASAFLGHLGETSAADLFCFTDLLRGSNLVENRQDLPGKAVEPTPAETCPQIIFPPTWEKYLQTLSPRTRKYLKQVSHFFLEEKGGTLKQANSNDYLIVLDKLFELHTQRWQAQGKLGSFATEPKKHFHQEISQRFLEKGQLGLYYLEADQKIISVLYGFSYLDTYYYYQSGFDLSYKRQSPGQIVLYYAIQRCFESGLKKFDFLRGQEEYKLKWANIQTETFHLLVPQTSKARLALTLSRKQKALKKKLKELVRGQS